MPRHGRAARVTGEAEGQTLALRLWLLTTPPTFSDAKSSLFSTLCSSIKLDVCEIVAGNLGASLSPGICSTLPLCYETENICRTRGVGLSLLASINVPTTLCVQFVSRKDGFRSTIVLKLRACARDHVRFQISISHRIGSTVVWLVEGGQRRSSATGCILSAQGMSLKTKCFNVFGKFGASVGTAILRARCSKLGLQALRDTFLRDERCIFILFRDECVHQ